MRNPVDTDVDTVNTVLEKQPSPRRGETTLCILMSADFADVSGGAELQVKYLIRYLEETYSSEIDIVFLTRSRPAREYQTVTARTWLKSGRKPAMFRWMETKRILRALKTINPDIVYQRCGNEYTGIVAYYCRKHKKRMIWHIAHRNHVVPVKLGFSMKSIPMAIEATMRNWGIRHADYIIGQAEYQSELLKRHYSRTCDRIVPNFHPVPTSEFRKADHPVKVVWVANMRPFKRPDLFIQLAQELSESQDAEFIMAGRLGNNNWAKDLLGKINSVPNLKYLGSLSLNEVNTLLETSHVFVSTSINEGFPNTFIQAWMRHVPVVSLDFDPDDVIQKEGVGKFAQTFSELKEGVSALIKDTELRDRIGRAAREYSETHHGMTNADVIARLMFQDDQ